MSSSSLCLLAVSTKILDTTAIEPLLLICFVASGNEAPELRPLNLFTRDLIRSERLVTIPPVLMESVI